jgi:L-threonate 2-dehydrogenase
VSRPIGIAGLGLMGSAFAARLIAAGHSVVGYDVNPARRDGFTAGCTVETPAALSALCRTIVLAVFDTDQVEQLVEGSEGLSPEVAGQALSLICTSTCDPDRIGSLAKRCAARNIQFLEAPISGTSTQVSNGQAVGLVGGEPALHAQLSPLLDVMCSAHHFIGAAGDANRAKLAVNLVLGLHRAALAEGLVFGERIGLDPKRLLEVMQRSAAASSVMPIKGPLMVSRKFDTPQSRVDQSLKDFALIRSLGTAHGQVLPLADVYVELLKSCVADGEGNLDNAVIVEAIRRRGMS